MLKARYQTILPIAAGGMGRVDLALRSDQGFERIYAVKRLHDQFEEDPGLRKMFLDEARLAGLIRHANVVSVLDVGEDEHGPYLVMDYVEGLTLTHILARHRKARAPLPLQLGLRIGSQMAAGLHAAHELCDAEGRPLKLVHRDVSPSNVIVGFDGVVRLTDFGVAKALGRSTQTDAGVLKGKLSYMSPEQFRFIEPDRRSDLFALGIVLYELLAGHHPFGDTPSDRAKNIIAGYTPDLGEEIEAPPEVVELLFELLAPDRDHRPSTADEVRLRLETLLVDQLTVEASLRLTDYMQRVYGEHLRDTRARIQVARASAQVRSGPAPEPDPTRTPHEDTELDVELGVEVVGTPDTETALRRSDTHATSSRSPASTKWSIGRTVIAALLVLASGVSGWVLIATVMREPARAPDVPMPRPATVPLPEAPQAALDTAHAGSDTARDAGIARPEEDTTPREPTRRRRQTRGGQQTPTRPGLMDW